MSTEENRTVKAGLQKKVSKKTRRKLETLPVKFNDQQQPIDAGSFEADNETDYAFTIAWKPDEGLQWAEDDLAPNSTYPLYFEAGLWDVVIFNSSLGVELDVILNIIWGDDTYVFTIAYLIG